jgi:hypothetical protein
MYAGIGVFIYDVGDDWHICVEEVDFGKFCVEAMVAAWWWYEVAAWWCEVI